MHVTVATEAQIPALCGLLRELFSLETEFTPDADAQYRGLANIIAHPQTGTILVAHEDETLVGMVNVLYTESTALGARVALIEDMIVTEAARGKGIGTMLMQAAFQAARAEGCKRITLLTDAHNTPALRFYARHGFGRSSMVPLRLHLD
jgi:GNAT superfamily N-acetyltransferase